MEIFSARVYRFLFVITLVISTLSGGNLLAGNPQEVQSKIEVSAGNAPNRTYMFDLMINHRQNQIAETWKNRKHVLAIITKPLLSKK